jgi:serine/threonine protein kinase
VKRVGRYEITELIGQGGMGTVYKAFDPLLARVVAIKVISAQFHTQPELRDRFFREARAAAQLAHRNIITIYDLGEEEGLPYLTMQFLEGRDLEQRMRSPEGMTLARKLEIALAMAEGLAHAHGSGVIHRDIKPANVFITDDGQVKILDFGLARLVTSELTRSNVMVGTVNYMAPEQLRGEKTDHRSDIFSIGVVLYELFGGKKPFQADSFASTMLKFLQETPEPLDSLDPELPPALVSAVDRAMAKAREDRYQYMIDLLRDLEMVYEPLRGSDRRVITEVSSALRPGPDGKPKSHPPIFIASPDAPTMVGTPIPESLRQTVAELAPPRPATPLPSPPPTVAPPVEPARTPPWRHYAIGIAALAAAVVALLVWSSRRPPSAPAAPVTSVTTAPAAPEPAKAPEAPAAVVPHPEPPDAVSADQGVAKADAAAAERQARQAREEQQSLARIAAEREHVARASTSLANAKIGAAAVNARELAPDLFAAAEKQEASAKDANARQQYAAAAARLEAAAALFRSAESTARSEAEARAARARAAEEQRHQPAPLPAPPATAAPATKPEPAARTEPPAAPPPAPTPAPAAPAPPRPEPVTLPPQTRTAREAGSAVLQRYIAALEHRDIAALKSVWPSLGGSQQAAIEAEFANAREIDVEFVDPKIEVAGQTMTVSGRRRYSLRTRDGQQLRSDTITTLALRQSGTDWVIESVRHQAVR